MNYLVCRDLSFANPGSLDGMVTIKKGGVVKGVSPEFTSPDVQKLLKKADQRFRSQMPPSRIVYFKAYGIVRYARALHDMTPTRDSVTVPVEQE